MFSSSDRMWLAVRGDQVALSQAFNAPDQGWLQASHYILMLMLSIVRLGAGSTWRPAEVHLQTAESAAHVTFAQPATAIVFPRALLDQPLPPPRLDLELSDDSNETWNASAPPDDFIESIVQVVEMLSWEGYPDIHLTADVLGTSVRTLQRHLTAAGITHGSLVARGRFATAAALLEETDANILDVALDLGYSDHAHFTRAFRRWSGCSPQEFRSRYRQLCPASRHACGMRSSKRGFISDICATWLGAAPGGGRGQAARSPID